MGERLKSSHGMRKHNRIEKGLARKQGREPNLIRPILPTKKRPTALEQSGVLKHSPSFTPIRELPSIARQLTGEPAVKKQRKEPVGASYMGAGMRLWAGAIKIKPDGKLSHEYVSDKKAVNILEELENHIRSDQPMKLTEIADQVFKLGSTVGPLGSLSTEIDIAAWRVLDAIKENKDKITK